MKKKLILKTVFSVVVIIVFLVFAYSSSDNNPGKRQFSIQSTFIKN